MHIGVPGKDTSVYHEFCRQNFGCYLDRPILQDDAKDAKMVVTHKYELTLTYLKNFSSVLNPLGLLWPEYSHENYVSDCHSTIWVTPKQLIKLLRDIESAAKRGEKTISNKSFGDSTNSIITSFEKSVAVSSAKPADFSKAKYKPSYQKKNLNVSKIFKAYDMNSAGDKTLHQRLTTKYGIDNDTASAWIMEFKKFVTMLVAETDPACEGNSFPSSIVENVWATYAQLGDFYRELSSNLQVFLSVLIYQIAPKQP